MLFIYSHYHGLPIIQELTHKYGLQADFGEATLGQKLEELREHIRKEIRKELKIKEGAENLRKVTTDRRAFQDVSHMVKEANSKLSALQQELQELDSQILLTQGQGGASLDSSFSNNLGNLKYCKGPYGLFYIWVEVSPLGNYKGQKRGL
nr:serine/threonine-protein kinase N-like [Penaeus vannamei]